jgi:hypothetical protein
MAPRPPAPGITSILPTSESGTIAVPTLKSAPKKEEEKVTEEEEKLGITKPVKPVKKEDIEPLSNQIQKVIEDKSEITSEVKSKLISLAKTKEQSATLAAAAKATVLEKQAKDDLEYLKLKITQNERRMNETKESVLSNIDLQIKDKQKVINDTKIKNLNPILDLEKRSNIQPDENLESVRQDLDKNQKEIDETKKENDTYDRQLRSTNTKYAKETDEPKKKELETQLRDIGSKLVASQNKLDEITKNINRIQNKIKVFETKPNILSNIEKFEKELQTIQELRNRVDTDFENYKEEKNKPLADEIEILKSKIPEAESKVQTASELKIYIDQLTGRGVKEKGAISAQTATSTADILKNLGLKKGGARRPEITPLITCGQLAPANPNVANVVGRVQQPTDYGDNEANLPRVVLTNIVEQYITDTEIAKKLPTKTSEAIEKLTVETLGSAIQKAINLALNYDPNFEPITTTEFVNRLNQLELNTLEEFIRVQLSEVIKSSKKDTKQQQDANYLNVPIGKPPSKQGKKIDKQTWTHMVQAVMGLGPDAPSSEQNEKARSVTLGSPGSEAYIREAVAKAIELMKNQNKRDSKLPSRVIDDPTVFLNTLRPEKIPNWDDGTKTAYNTITSGREPDITLSDNDQIATARAFFEKSSYGFRYPLINFVAPDLNTPAKFKYSVPPRKHLNKLTPLAYAVGYGSKISIKLLVRENTNFGVFVDQLSLYRYANTRPFSDPNRNEVVDIMKKLDKAYRDAAQTEGEKFMKENYAEGEGEDTSFLRETYERWFKAFKEGKTPGQVLRGSLEEAKQKGKKDGLIPNQEPDDNFIDPIKQPNTRIREVYMLGFRMGKAEYQGILDGETGNKNNTTFTNRLNKENVDEVISTYTNGLVKGENKIKQRGFADAIVGKKQDPYYATSRFGLSPDLTQKLGLNLTSNRIADLYNFGYSYGVRIFSDKLNILIDGARHDGLQDGTLDGDIDTRTNRFKTTQTVKSRNLMEPKAVKPTEYVLRYDELDVKKDNFRQLYDAYVSSYNKGIENAIMDKRKRNTGGTRRHKLHKNMTKRNYRRKAE